MQAGRKHLSRAFHACAGILLTMKSIVLFEDEGFVDLLPLVYWRTVFELRVGRKIMLDRTAQRLGLTVSGVWTRAELAKVAAQRCGAPANQPVDRSTILVNGRWLLDRGTKLPTRPCVGVVDDGVAFIVCDGPASKRLTPRDLLEPSRWEEALEHLPRKPATGRLLRYPWEIIADLPELLRSDWDPSDASIETPLDTRVIAAHKDRIHVGEHTTIHPTAIVDASEGPIFISHDVRIGPYCVIEGPAYIGPGTWIHPYTRLHGGNAVGPICRVGGELDGCVLDGYTNKQHVGFLGHAYVGSWVNLGAGSVNSDLKNTYGTVRVPINGREVDTGRRFFGGIIGDFAKIGINATIPTGSVIGFAASVAATRLLPKWLPSFSWVTEERVTTGDPLRLLDAASAMMARRNIDMTDEEVELFLELRQVARTYEARA